MTKAKMVIIGVLVAVGIGFVFAMLSFSYRTLTEVSDVYPEYTTFDSTYIQTRGFPSPQWAVNDLNSSAVNSEVLWPGILINWGLYAIGIGILGSPGLIIFVMHWSIYENVRGKTTANHHRRIFVTSDPDSEKKEKMRPTTRSAYRRWRGSG
jgi:hypothetical protein